MKIWFKEKTLRYRPMIHSQMSLNALLDEQGLIRFV
jgi:hypothetical protein